MIASAVILAGGKSRRLGIDKSMAEIGGRPLILRTVETLQQLTADVVVVTAADHPLPVLDDRPDVRVAQDLLPGKGALGGILTGLTAAKNTYSIVVACDMPFLNATLLNHMVQSCEGFDLVIPRFDGYMEPLHAVYSKTCLPAIQNVLSSNELKILSFLPYVKVRYVDEDEIDLFDPSHLSFLNINTEQDLRRAIEIGHGNQ